MSSRTTAVEKMKLKPMLGHTRRLVVPWGVAVRLSIPCNDNHLILLPAAHTISALLIGTIYLSLSPGLHLFEVKCVFEAYLPHYCLNLWLTMVNTRERSLLLL